MDQSISSHVAPTRTVADPAGIGPVHSQLACSGSFSPLAVNKTRINPKSHTQHSNTPHRSIDTLTKPRVSSALRRRSPRRRRGCPATPNSASSPASSAGCRGASPPLRSAPSSGSSSTPTAGPATTSAPSGWSCPRSIASAAPTASRSPSSPPASSTPSACPGTPRTLSASSTGAAGAPSPAPMLAISLSSPPRYGVLDLSETVMIARCYIG